MFLEPRPLHLAELSPGTPYQSRSHVLPFATRWLRRDYFELLAVLDGEARLVAYAAGRELSVRTLRAGGIVLFRPGEAPVLAPSSASGVRIALVSFYAADWRIFAGLTGLRSAWARAASPPASASRSVRADVVRAFERALERYHTEPSGVDLLRFLVETVPALIPRADHLGSEGPPRWLVEAWNEMLDEDNLRVGLPRVLRLSHAGHERLARLTRAHFGVTPSAFLNELRLRHAARLLSSSAESIGVIASRCGFHRSNYFTDRFHRMHGLSPRQYRVRAGSYRPQP